MVSAVTLLVGWSIVVLTGTALIAIVWDHFHDPMRRKRVKR